MGRACPAGGARPSSYDGVCGSGGGDRIGRSADPDWVPSSATRIRFCPSRSGVRRRPQPASGRELGLNQPPERISTLTIPEPPNPEPTDCRRRIASGSLPRAGAFNIGPEPFPGGYPQKGRPPGGDRLITGRPPGDAASLDRPSAFGGHQAKERQSSTTNDPWFTPPPSGEPRRRPPGRTVLARGAATVGRCSGTGRPVGDDDGARRKSRDVAANRPSCRAAARPAPGQGCDRNRSRDSLAQGLRGSGGELDGGGATVPPIFRFGDRREGTNDLFDRHGFLQGQRRPHSRPAGPAGGRRFDRNRLRQGVRRGPPA